MVLPRPASMPPNMSIHERCLCRPQRARLREYGWNLHERTSGVVEAFDSIGAQAKRCLLPLTLACRPVFSYNIAARQRRKKAISHYTDAIRLDGKNATYYNNRAAAYLKMCR